MNKILDGIQVILAIILVISFLMWSLLGMGFIESLITIGAFVITIALFSLGGGS